jgi:hypothetical protein
MPEKIWLGTIGSWLMVREVSSRLLLLGSTKRTKDRPTPPILASRQKETKRPSGFPRLIGLGKHTKQAPPRRIYLRKGEQEIFNEHAE